MDAPNALEPATPGLRHPAARVPDSPRRLHVADAPTRGTASGLEWAVVAGALVGWLIFSARDVSCRRAGRAA